MTTPYVSGPAIDQGTKSRSFILQYIMSIWQRNEPCALFSTSQGQVVPYILPFISKSDGHFIHETDGV